MLVLVDPKYFYTLVLLLSSIKDTILSIKLYPYSRISGLHCASSMTVRNGMQCIICSRNLCPIEAKNRNKHTLLLSICKDTFQFALYQKLPWRVQCSCVHTYFLTLSLEQILHTSEYRIFYWKEQSKYKLEHTARVISL